MTNTDDTLALAQRFYGAINSGDMDAARACLHPELRMAESPLLPYGGTYRGIEGFDALLGAAFAHVVPPMVVRTITVAENHFAAVIDMRARATGDPVVVFEHWTVESGLLREGQIAPFDRAPFNP